MVRQIILDAAQHQGGDGQRVYLTGFSFGANGVFDLALAQPDLWAALWPVNPTRVPPQPITLPLWLSFGEISRDQARSFIRRLALRPRIAPRRATVCGTMTGRIMSAPRSAPIAMPVFTSGYSANDVGNNRCGGQRRAHAGRREPVAQDQQQTRCGAHGTHGRF